MISITFEKDGTIKFIFDDKLAPVAQAIGTVTINRASHVEPVTVAWRADPMWEADMSPVGGPKLGPFEARGDALQAERSWLIAHDIPIPR